MDTILDLLGRVTALIDSLAALVTDAPVTYLIILAMAAVDVIVPLLPAEATVTAAAVLAGQGRLTIFWVMLAAGLGAFIGDNVAYWIGRAAGRPLVGRVLRGNTEQLDGVAAQFDKRGGVFIIIGRFVPGGRTAVAVGAGVLEFSWPQFVLYDALAAVIWAFQAALPGYVGGSLIQDQPWLAMVFGFILSAILAASIALLQRWWDGRRAVEVELPIKPAVLGIGSVEVHLAARDRASEAVDGSGLAAPKAAGHGENRADAGPPNEP
jgi:membrane protein DedA with SNARE-associated domain